MQPATHARRVWGAHGCSTELTWRIYHRTIHVYYSRNITLHQCRFWKKKLFSFFYQLCALSIDTTKICNKQIMTLPRRLTSTTMWLWIEMLFKLTKGAPCNVIDLHFSLVYDDYAVFRIFFLFKKYATCNNDTSGLVKESTWPRMKYFG